MKIKLAVWAIALTAGFGVTTAQAEEFAVGSVISLTGANARGGSGMHEGIMTAVEVFNRQQSKHKIKLVTIDDESAPAKAIAGVEQLASQNVVAITGGATSDLVGPASTAANKLGLVYITSGGTSEELISQGYKKFFRINNTSGYVHAMTGMFSDMGIKSLSIIYSTKKSTNELAVDVDKIMTAKGVKVTLHPFDPAITDFKPILNKVRLQDRPDAINMLGYENDYVGILRAAKVLKPNVKALVGVWQIANAKMAGDFPDLVPNVSGTEILPYPVAFSTAEGKLFETTFKALYHKSPDYLGEYGFVQSMALFEAIARAADKGSLKKGGLADEMRKTDRDTLIGRLQFNDKGDNPNFIQHIGQHQGGKIVIVWPKEFATGKMNFPGVPW
ncbi:ABC transporter substrate-binding protein [Undibacterium sp.]|jgi:branched-chain amino acid transport system substrate-binding protein|uniref:ABC transporter substrate-binding protein n=1 Tax=Undibacterium sp. TaxID=1914977 RepID=UPI002C0F142D|nr:ABC transporter substrate-binding protein [Undibacterium sp.]HTD05618.1 ABC transporter substrate-binding protein [Undibacterium sp.]